AQRPEIARIVVTDDPLRLLVQRTPDAVTGEVANDLEAVRLRDALRRPADLVDPPPVARLRDGIAQRAPRRMAKPVLEGVRRRHDARAAGIGKVAVEHGRDVDVHDVAGPDHPVSGHAVRGLLVHADAGRAGEVVDRLRGGARTVLIEEAPADL